ncbi:MAG: Gfo/Idh/MocA family oxidoreductase [Spirochaetaceae bacterium]|jgi:predicted dehydrogenase|nr:Gfo/Idh/MocA family oxidoreductase [Spirochaetaceae bacterium]
MKKVKFGVIGMGNMGGLHAKYLIGGAVENAELSAVADIDPEKLESFKKTAGGEYSFFHDGKELIGNADVDAVIVATPHYSHCELSIAALEKGIHTVCEKPAGVYAKQVKEMNAVAAKSKSLFTVMFNHRMNPIYIKMRDMVRGGDLGSLKRVTWHITNWYRPQSYYDSSNWRATWAGEGGGVLVNQCPHQLDLLQWIVGMPAKVHAKCHFGKWHNIETEDDVSAYLEFPDGATGVFITSTGDYPGTDRFEIVGSKGQLVAENGALTFYRLAVDEREYNKTFKGLFGAPEYTTENFSFDSRGPQHVGILNNFANAIQGIEPLYIDGREGLKGVELMNGILLSCWLNKEVALPADENLFLSELQERAKKTKKKTVRKVDAADMNASFR